MDSSEFFTVPVAPSGYTNFEVLSESGFNILYSLEREGKRFVVKALSEGFRGNMLYESLLRKEFEIAYLLDHPHICRIYSFEQFPGIGNAIVMEWLDGRTLDQYMASKRHTTEELIRIVEQLSDALSYAHKRQVIHRDIKPQNIIVTHNGDNVKLLDFGLSDTDRHTTLKAPAGSRKYASPELQRCGEVDSRSDIYSLGIILDELFEGQRSRKISKIVTRATAYYPQARYAEAHLVVDALRYRPVKVVYPILCLIFLAIGYLFYSINLRTDVPQIPSAETDGVTVEEFERRQVLSNRFYETINNSYLSLMNDGVYKMSCATPEMPNFEALSREQLVRYQQLLDSMMGEINSSSLYQNARRNITSHNSELFTIMQNSFPSMFWLNTEQLFRAANDSLATALRRLPSPDIDSNYGVMSYEEQQEEAKRYQDAVKEYKKNTVGVWAVDYRESRNLSPLPEQLLEYYN